MNINNFELTPLKYLTREEYNIAMKWSIKSFTVELEPTNEYDNEALIVYKTFKGKKYKCGYIKKKTIIYTPKSQIVYIIKEDLF